MIRTFYDVLGVGRDATPAQIRQAYREKARLYHPDAGGDAELMKLLNVAYETLMRRRAEYDQQLAAAETQAAQDVVRNTAESTPAPEQEVRTTEEPEEARAERPYISTPPAPGWVHLVWAVILGIPLVLAAVKGYEALLLYLLMPLVRFVFVIVVLLLGYDPWGYG